MIDVLIIFSCIFSGIVAIDVIVKNRRVLQQTKLNRKTRKEWLDEVDQKEWDKYLDEKYSTFPSWYVV